MVVSPLPRYAKGFIRNKPGVATAVVSGLDSGVAYFWKATSGTGVKWDIVMVAGGGLQVQWYTDRSVQMVQQN